MRYIYLPDLGEGITEAVVACWHCSAGDSVAADTDVVEVVTDKASFNVPAGEAGVIQEILIQEGQTAAVGDPLARLQ